MKLYLPIAILLFIAGLSNGLHETILHHYSSSRLPQQGEKWHDWLNPGSSWELKYKDWPDDKRAAFPGSKTVLVFLTDAYHLTKFIYHGCIRAALVIVLISFIGQLYHWTRLKRWLYGVAIWFIAAGIQAIGFHLLYTLILPQ